MAEGHESDLLFSGSIPELYDRYLVPLIFQPYATDLARRVGALGATSVLEVAAGTGVVTRALTAALGASIDLTATDLNQPMVDHAQALGTAAPVRWQTADAMALPFDDATFDAVVCQFGVMFFPDRATAFAEVARVLRPGGTFLFNTWDRIDSNELAALVTDALAALFPTDPPMFLARTPHGYHDEEVIRADVAAAGFAPLHGIDALAARSRAASAELPAIGYCQGTPLRNELTTRDPDGLRRATEAATAAIAARFGPTDIDAQIRAFVVSATKR